MTTLAVTVGVAVSAMAGSSGSAGCSGSVPGAVDVVCYNLVRTLAERIGLVTAAATAIVVLTMVGLSRTAAAVERTSLRPGATGSLADRSSEPK